MKKIKSLILCQVLIFCSIIFSFSQSKTITTTKRGYATQTGWEWITSDMKVGHDHNIIVNDVNQRAFAWFDIPSDIRDGEITSATLTVSVKDISKWNEWLTAIELYTVDQIWYTFRNSYNFGTGVSSWHYHELAGNSNIDINGKETTLTFSINPAYLNNKSERGFSFRAFPEIPSDFWGKKTNEIILNNPTLRIVYTEEETLPSKATNPSPSNGATNQSRTVDPSWSNGGGATSYNLYFGTDPSPDNTEYKGNSDETSYNPGTLAYNTKYYWRIDAKNSAGTTTGTVWNFTTENESTQLPNLTRVYGLSTLTSTGSSFSNYIRVANNGNSTSNSCYVRYYLSKNKSLSKINDYPIGRNYVKSLSPDDFSDEYFSFDAADLDIPIGEYYFFYFIDYEEKIDESKEDDNKFYWNSPKVKIENDEYITIISPNGGENWAKGSSHNITWNDNISSNVKIELYKGSSRVSTITSSTSSDGSLNWTVPSNLIPATNYKIKITSTSNSSLNDYSNNYFTVSDVDYITVTSPNGGENWAKGSSHNITWNDNISSNVKIELYKGSSRVSTITSSTSSDGSLNWTVPSNLTPATNYKIKITSTSNSSLNDYSNNYFTISENHPPNKPILISPNDGAIFNVGESMNYEALGTDEDSDSLEYHFYEKYGSNDWHLWKSFSTSTSTYFYWNFPFTVQWRVKTVDIHGAESEFSNIGIYTVIENHPPEKPFIISPTVGETLNAPFTINWNCSDPDEDDTLEYFVFASKDSFSLDSHFVFDFTESTSVQFDLAGTNYDYRGDWFCIIVANDGKDTIPSDIVKFKLDWPTSAENIVLDQKITIFPNPATDYVNVKTNFNSQDMIIQLLNSSGLKLREIVGFDTFDNTPKRINLQGLPHGIYFIKIYNSKFSKTEKIIVN